MNTPDRPEDRPKDDRPNDRPEIESAKTPPSSDPVPPTHRPSDAAPSAPSSARPGVDKPAEKSADRPGDKSAGKPAQTPPVGPMPGPTRTAPPKPTKPTTPAKPPREPRPPRRGGSALAVILALLALAAVAYVGWQQWQQQRADRSSAQSSAQSAAALQSRMDSSDKTVQKLTAERTALSQQISDAGDASRNLQASVNGQNERLRGIEGAVARLSQQTLSGHDAMLLDQTDSLLRMAGERYRLFHDARGAAAAYASANQTLAAVNDEAFAGVRESVKQERESLLKSRAANEEAAMAQLDQLRGAVAKWPLRPLDPPSSTSEGGTVWARIGHALSSVVSIERDNGAPLAVADTRLSRELAALDLAQAQAALLAHDANGYLGALKRVDGSLEQQFDAGATAVREARETLAGLIKNAQPAAAVSLGGALEQLRNLRAVHALSPAPTASAAAPGTSAAPAAVPGQPVNEPAPSASATRQTPAPSSSVPAPSGSAGATP